MAETTLASNQKWRQTFNFSRVVPLYIFTTLNIICLSPCSLTAQILHLLQIFPHCTTVCTTGYLKYSHSYYILYWKCFRFYLVVIQHISRNVLILSRSASRGTAVLQTFQVYYMFFKIRSRPPLLMQHSFQKVPVKLQSHCNLHSTCEIQITHFLCIFNCNVFPFVPKCRLQPISISYSILGLLQDKSIREEMFQMRGR